MKNTKIYKATKCLLMSLIAVCLLIGFDKPANAANVQISVKALTAGESCTVKNAGNVTSSKKSVASVKAMGNNKFKITTLKKGKSTINIYNGKGKLTKRVYLLSGNKKSFKYSTSTGYLEKGQSATVKASTNMSGVTIQYSSTKPAVATVNANGKITAKKAGGTYITATFYYKGLKAKAIKKPVYVFSASYDTSAISMTAGNTKTVAASVSSNCSASYKSSDTSVATVSSVGKIAAKKKGTATITATVSLSGKTVKTFTKKVTVKAASTTTASSGSSSSNSSSGSSTSTSKSTGSSSSSSSSGSSSGSSSSKSSSSGSSSSNSSSGSSSGSSSSSSGNSSSGSASTDVNVGDDGYIYHYSRGSNTLSGGRSTSICCYTNKNSDVFSFTTSNDCLVMSEIGESTCYDSLNDCQCRSISCTFTARIAGTCDVCIYRNGTLVRTITYTITSTDTDYYEYEAWRKGLEEELWTSGMSCYEKILTLGNYVFARYPYNASCSSPYGYSQGIGADCWGSSYLLIDVAHDLGLDAEPYSQNGLTYGHMMAKIILEDGRIWVCANSASSSDPYGSIYGGIYPAGTVL